MDPIQSIDHVLELYICIAFIISLILKIPDYSTSREYSYSHKFTLIFSEIGMVCIFFRFGLYFTSLAMIYFLCRDTGEIVLRLAGTYKANKPRTEYDIRTPFVRALGSIFYVITLIFLAVSLGKWFTSAASIGWPSHLTLNPAPYTDALIMTLLIVPHIDSAADRSQKFFYVGLGYVVISIVCFKIGLFVLALPFILISLLTFKTWITNMLDFGGSCYGKDSY